jgi:protocatechuate 3,4-dioxygenase beta subunit
MRGNHAVEDTGITISGNTPGDVITDETYSDFFDENGVLISLFDNNDLIVSGDFVDNNVFIFDDVNVTFTSDGTAVFHDGQIWTSNNATVTFDGLVFNNTMDAFVLESAGNTIKNTVINIDSDNEIHAIYIYENDNIIQNTSINIVAPSANVIYNPDYSVNTPAPAAIVVSANNTLIDGVDIYFDGREAIHNPDPSAWDAPTVDGIYLVSSTTPIENNTILNTNVEVIGGNYAYGINVGNAKNTVLDEIDVDVTCAYYADAIQLFDADTISITGEVKVTADSEAYGVYSTAMGTGFSKNINLTGLDITVNSKDATGVLIEGSSNVTMADAVYDITGDKSTAIEVSIDWMKNIPTGIVIDNVEMSIDGTEENNVLQFTNASDVSITDCEIVSTRGSEINFENTPNSEVVGNYIKINDVIAGNFAVISTNDDTIIENNTPSSKKMEEMQETIDELQKELDELKGAKNTTLTLDEITDARYKANVTISGTLVNEDNIGLFNQVVTLTIGDTEVNVTTKGGVFEYTTSFKELGDKNVTARYAGTDKYLASEATMTFNVEKQDIIITCDPIKDTQYKADVTITGKATDVTGQALYNINVVIKINGKLFKAKTDKTGAFTLTTTATQTGENTVTLSYGGNANYNGNEATATFNVEKQDIVITYDAIADAKYKDTVTITGKVTDVTGKALYNINVIIKINGKTYKAKTDKTGAFTLTATATATGENKVTLSYAGNANYNGYEVSTTFNVEKQDIAITYNPIKDTVSGEDVTITGTIKDANGNAVYNVNVIIRINNKQFKAKSDKTGAFTLTTTATTLGTNNVTLSYDGNTNLNSYETKTTFNVIAKAE